LVIAGVLLTLIASAAGLLWLHHVLWGVRSPQLVELEIVEGISARQILRLLVDEGLLPSENAGRLYLKVEAEGRGMRFGHYVFPSGSRPVDVLEQILEGRVEMFSITVVEGSDVVSIGDQFVRLGVGSEADWTALSSRVAWIGQLVPSAPSLEGFFFPDTYRFAVGISAPAAARHLVDRFLEVWGEETGGQTELWGTPLDVVTLASLVEAETSVPEERAVVAGVFLNRLRRGILLQCDPTVVFALKRRQEWSGRLLRIHWEVDDPYNTYRYPGLPPGPINSPGRAALTAALQPEPTPFLYFVARPGGGHAFSRTLAEHNRSVAELHRSRR
jgi:UPF0755 protein